MRLFIAIDIPEEIKKYLREVQGKLPGEDVISMRKTMDFHLTLKFLGSVDENKKDEIVEQLKTVSFKPFTLELSKLGVFGSWNFPRVIWVGVSSPEVLFETQKIIEEKMADFGFERENRFSPHLTLGRVKSVKNPQKCKEQLSLIKIEPKKFKAEKFYLFQSHLGTDGAVYEKLQITNHKSQTIDELQ